MPPVSGIEVGRLEIAGRPVTHDSLFLDGSLGMNFFLDSVLLDGLDEASSDQQRKADGRAQRSWHARCEWKHRQEPMEEMAASCSR